MINPRVLEEQHNHVPALQACRGTSQTSFGALLSALVLNACGGDYSESGNEETFSSIEQGIANADQVRPSEMNGGTVHVRVWGPSGQQEDCSGQVISRDSVLTAAHCFTNAGYTYSSAISASVYLNHQEPGGWWTPFTNNPETVTVYIQQQYFTNLSDAEARSGYDVAVVQRNTPLSNVVSGDVAALARSTYQKPLGLYAYGHGNYRETILGDRGPDNIVYDDEQLRRGKFTNLTWYTSSSNARYRSVMTDYGTGDAHFCAGDSGGPWKAWDDQFSTGPNVSGVQFAVTSRSGPLAPHCGADKAFGAMVAYNATWIANRVEDGAGSCTNYQHIIQNDVSWIPGYATVNTKVCW